MELTARTLALAGANPKYAALYVDLFNKYLAKFGITTPLRLAHFFSQVLWESRLLTAVKEEASGHAYEGRKNLGNFKPGDGVKYKGRGLIQTTGGYNYQSVSKALKVDYVNNPEWLERPEDAVLSALWYWSSRNLNKYADRDDVLTLTKRINGGVNGLAGRTALLEQCKHAFERLGNLGSNTGNSISV